MNYQMNGKINQKHLKDKKKNKWKNKGKRIKWKERNKKMTHLKHKLKYNKLKRMKMIVLRLQRRITITMNKSTKKNK